MQKVFWLLISLLFLVVYFAKLPVRAQDTLPPFVILGQCQKGFSACFSDCRRSYSESTINWERNRIRCGNICINKRAKCDYQAWRKLGVVIKPPVDMPIEPPQPRAVIAKPQPKRVQPQPLTPVAKPAPKIRSQSPKNTNEKKPVIAVMSNETRRISELDKKSADTQIADASTSQNKHFVSLAEQWDGRLVNSLCTSKSAINKAYCAISIGASIGMLTTLKLIEKDSKLKKVICIPPNLIPFEQTNDIVAKYIKDNIKKRNMSLSVLVVLALRKAYPCKK
jgi:hypothetical protein